jgi:hypothetical protein
MPSLAGLAGETALDGTPGRRNLLRVIPAKEA